MRVTWAYCLEVCGDRKRGSCTLEAPRRMPRRLR